MSVSIQIKIGLVSLRLIATSLRTSWLLLAIHVCSINLLKITMPSSVLLRINKKLVGKTEKINKQKTHTSYINFDSPEGVYLVNSSESARYFKHFFFQNSRTKYIQEPNVAKLEGKLISAVNNFFSSPIVNQIRDFMVSIEFYCCYCFFSSILI